MSPLFELPHRHLDANLLEVVWSCVLEIAKRQLGPISATIQKIHEHDLANPTPGTFESGLRQNHNSLSSLLTR